MPADSYNGLKAFAFIVGVTFLIFSILYVTKRYNPNLFAHEAFSQNYPWYIGRFSDPPPDRARPSVGEKPAMWDVWIASWHPSQPETSGLGTTDAEPDAGRAANEEKRLGWAEFLPLSADKVSDAAAPVPSLKVTGGDPTPPTTSTQIRISTIIFMPALPPPSTSPPNPTSGDTNNPIREYAIGTSHAPQAAT